MTNALILGGTGWLSGRIARRLLDDGIAVTCLARGGRAAPEGAALAIGDRDSDTAYEAVRESEWDHVIDISSRADHVAAAVAALGAGAARWTYVSSMSAYSDDETVGADESAPLHAPAAPGDEYEYGSQKVAAEEAVRTLGARALVVRPGLIVGAGDPSDRFGYWAAAFARAGAEPVLVPEVQGRSFQVIDVDDLAEYIVASTATGAANTIGDRHPLGDVLNAVRAAAGHTGELKTADDDWLEAHGVGFWAGARSLPLWLPADMTGFMTRSNERFLETGGTLRPLADTIAAVLADERARGVDRERKAGLTRAEERELLTALG
ncbi:MAG: NAD-dependent epimerase/dehydratase family protein [Microbacterium sp.]|nr:NAD-dependent epimerase/dehydratase family protein [Microbacterium sp.]